ncbi:MAG: FAD binding domain-containing protein [Thermomicrobiales bacterium]
MFPSEFEYYRASSVDEAIKLLGDHPDAKIIAGGHSLLPAMKLRLAAPTGLVDIGHIENLHGISVNGGATIGALTTYRELEDAQELKSQFPIIAETANVVGDPAVRSRGTLGGSLAHSDPAADFPAVILALGGSVKVVGPSGERTISADDLFVDLFTTSLAEDELLTQVVIPSPSGHIGMAYEKHSHPASGYAVVGVAVVLGISNGTCQSARIAITGATTKATRATAAEQALVGQPLNADTVANVAEHAADGIEANGDIYASAEYRTHLVKVYAKRALMRAAGL